MIQDSVSLSVPIKFGGVMETFFIKITTEREVLDDLSILNAIESKNTSLKELIQQESIKYFNETKSFNTDDLLDIVFKIVRLMKLDLNSIYIKWKDIETLYMAKK